MELPIYWLTQDSYSRTEIATRSLQKIQVYFHFLSGEQFIIKVIKHILFFENEVPVWAGWQTVVNVNELHAIISIIRY